MYGLKANDLESFSTLKGYKAYLYRSSDCTGVYRLVADGTTVLGLTSTYLNLVNSIKIEAVADGIENTEAQELQVNIEGNTLYIDNGKNEQFTIFNLLGQKVSQTLVLSKSEAYSLTSLCKGTYIIRVGNKSLKIVR